MSTSLRPLSGLSICETTAYTSGGTQLHAVLRQVLGVTFPAPNSAFVAGTRSVLRPDTDDRAFVMTEGESESALYRRLLRAVPADVGAVFDVSHAFVGLRFEGPHSEAALGALSDRDPAEFAEGSVHRFVCDDAVPMLHRRERLRWDFYIPRSQADAFRRMLERVCLDA